MTGATYGELFNEYLREILDGTDDMERWSLFSMWIQDRQFHCEKCGNEFEVAAAEIDPGDLAQCRKCSRG